MEGLSGGPRGERSPQILEHPCTTRATGRGRLEPSQQLLSEDLILLRCICQDALQTYPGSLVGKGPACKCRRGKRQGFNPWAGKILWRRKWQPTLIFLPGESHGQRSLEDYSPRGHNESDMTEYAHHVCKLRHHLDSLKHKEMSQGIKAQGR